MGGDQREQSMEHYGHQLINYFMNLLVYNIKDDNKWWTRHVRCKTKLNKTCVDKRLSAECWIGSEDDICNKNNDGRFIALLLLYHYQQIASKITMDVQILSAVEHKTTLINE